jgi:hypothetical protein
MQPDGSQDLHRVGQEGRQSHVDDDEHDGDRQLSSVQPAIATRNGINRVSTIRKVGIGGDALGGYVGGLTAASGLTQGFTTLGGDLYKGISNLKPNVNVAAPTVVVN